MCGRFALAVNVDELPQKFNDSLTNAAGDVTRSDGTSDGQNSLKEVSNGVFEVPAKENESSHTEIVLSNIKSFKPSYNIPPTRTALIIYLEKSPKENVDYRYVIESSNFGLVPVWAKPQDPSPVTRGGKPGPKYSKELQRHQSKYFNCRKESLAQHQAVWNSSKKNKRCVVPIQGYFEWLKTSKEKTPYYIYSPKFPLKYLAGLYSHNTNYKEENYIGESDFLSTFTIITGPATKKDSKDLSWLHNRKPIMLVPGSKEWFDWLDPENEWSDDMLDTCLDTEENKAFMDLEGYPVSKDIGNPATDGEYLIKGIKEGKGSQKLVTSFFQKGTKRTKEEPDDEKKAKKKTKKEEAKQEGKTDQGFEIKEE